MNCAYPIEAEAFRTDVRRWLAKNLGDDLRGLRVHDDPTPENIDRVRAWNRRVADAGYVAIGWPKRFGGRDASVAEQLVLAEELAAVNAPGVVNPIGLSNIAPAIMAHGTDGQRERFLERLRRGDDIWCQGFSEPDAGSDLASLRTTARVDGGDFVVTGTKIWTTLGVHADFCELLVRTDPTASNHRALSCLLVDMSLPGITARPLVTMTGGREFAELHFDAVRVARSALLGEENEGWRVAMATLSYERAGVANLYMRLQARLDALAAHIDVSNPITRQEVARCQTEITCLRLLALRVLSAAHSGREPGPEASTIKYAWSRTGQRLAGLAGRAGPASLVDASFVHETLIAPSLTIAGGTTEVQRNIIGERVLGLPRH